MHKRDNAGMGLSMYKRDNAGMGLSMYKRVYHKDEVIYVQEG
jgi:hypothetical protein